MFYLVNREVASGTALHASERVLDCIECISGRLT
jgi:hypothetical protein